MKRTYKDVAIHLLLFGSILCILSIALISGCVEDASTAKTDDNRFTVINSGGHLVVFHDNVNNVTIYSSGQYGGISAIPDWMIPDPRRVVKE